jgi:hypothetical protein
VVKRQDQHIQIDLQRQQLRLLSGNVCIASYTISSARNGAGESRGSECTPRGLHRVRLKIGDGLPENSVFIGRRHTGEIYTPALAAAHPGRDWILTRILWLSGLEPGRNRGGSVDSLRRFIYIHGTPDSEPMGQAASHGCIRMRNRELIELFERVAVGTVVEIREGG